MNSANTIVSGLVLLGLMNLAGPALADTRGTGCHKVIEITSCSGTSCTTGTNISSEPSKICSVQFIATSSNGFAQVFDSPDDTPTHGQAANKAEPGRATSGESVSHFFGDQGLVTDYSLGALVSGGRLIVQYDD